MNQLQQLFESAVLTDETKQAMTEAFNTAVSARAVEIEAEYAQKLAEAKTEMSDMLPSIIEEAVAEELAAVAEEVAHARTIEVEYATKLTEFKESYDAAQSEKLATMVAEAVAEEVEELKESIEFARKHQFAMNIFESYREAFEAQFGGVDAEALAELKEAKVELDAYKRKEKINELLEGVTGDKRAIAETILEGVATEKLDAKFESIRGVLLAESDKGENDATIVESSNTDAAEDGKGTVVIDEGVTLSQEDADAVVTESTDPMIIRLQKSVKAATRR
jgi:hypothetical protein